MMAAGVGSMIVRRNRALPYLHAPTCCLPFFLSRLWSDCLLFVVSLRFDFFMHLSYGKHVFMTTYKNI